MTEIDAAIPFEEDTDHLLARSLGFQMVSTGEENAAERHPGDAQRREFHHRSPTTWRIGLQNIAGRSGNPESGAAAASSVQAGISC